MIVENPANAPHYLSLYFPIKPTMTDQNRNLNGDYYKKPTNYWFVNCKPEDNFITEPIEYVQPWNINRTTTKTNNMDRQTTRSMMHPQYARRFILQHILDGVET